MCVVTTMPDPWRRLWQEWSHVRVQTAALPAGTYGLTRWSLSGDPTITLSSLAGEVQQRCTLAHEIEHLWAGPPPPGHQLSEERVIREATARWLLPDIDELAQVLVRHSWFSAALLFRVTPRVMAQRYRWFTDDEYKIVMAARPELGRCA